MERRQLFAAAPTLVGGPLTVAATDREPFGVPSVAVAANGSFAVASFGVDSTVWVQRYTAGGSAPSAAFAMVSHVGFATDVVGDAKGDLIVATTDAGSHGVVLSAVAADQSWRTSIDVARSTGAVTVTPQTIAVSGAGRGLVVYAATSTSTGCVTLRGQLFTLAAPTGGHVRLGPSFAIDNSTGVFNVPAPSAAVAADGSFAVVYNTLPGVARRTFSPTGVARSNPIVARNSPNDEWATVAVDAAGVFTAGWDGINPADGTGVFTATRFRANGVAVGSPFTVPDFGLAAVLNTRPGVLTVVDDVYQTDTLSARNVDAAGRNPSARVSVNGPSFDAVSGAATNGAGLAVVAWVTPDGHGGFGVKAQRLSIAAPVPTRATPSATNRTAAFVAPSQASPHRRARATFAPTATPRTSIV